MQDVSAGFGNDSPFKQLQAENVLIFIEVYSVPLLKADRMQR